MLGIRRDGPLGRRSHCPVLLAQIESVAEDQIESVIWGVRLRWIRHALTFIGESHQAEADARPAGKAQCEFKHSYVWNCAQSKDAARERSCRIPGPASTLISRDRADAGTGPIRPRWFHWAVDVDRQPHLGGLFPRKFGHCAGHEDPSSTASQCASIKSVDEDHVSAQETPRGVYKTARTRRTTAYNATDGPQQVRLPNRLLETA